MDTPINLPVGAGRGVGGTEGGKHEQRSCGRDDRPVVLGDPGAGPYRHRGRHAWGRPV